MAALIVEEQKAAFTAGEWSGARQEIQNCLTQLEANADGGLKSLREILPPEAIFPSDQNGGPAEAPRPVLVEEGAS